MRGLSLYAFPLVALTELWILLQVGSLIGGWATVGLVMLTGFIGITLLRRQGFQLLMQVQQRMQQGEMPAQEMLEGVCLLFGGLMLLTPGFLTDTLGFLLLLPPSRRVLMAHFGEKILSKMVVQPMGSMNGRPGASSGPFSPSGTTFEGEYSREETVVIRLDEQKK